MGNTLILLGKIEIQFDTNSIDRIAEGTHLEGKLHSSKGMRIDGTVIGIANLSDMVIGAVFYLFLLLGCKPLLSKFLKTEADTSYTTSELSVQNIDELDLTKFSISYRLMKMIALALGMAVIGGVIGIIIWMITGVNYSWILC